MGMVIPHPKPILIHLQLPLKISNQSKSEAPFASTILIITHQFAVCPVKIKFF